MDLLRVLKEIPNNEKDLEIFLRMSTVVGNIRSVDAVSSRVFKKKNSEDFCQVLSIRNVDFDGDYLDYFGSAKGIELEEYDDGEVESLEMNIIHSINDLISALELNKTDTIKDVRYSAITAIVGKEMLISSVVKDTYGFFGKSVDCYIIELKESK